MSTQKKYRKIDKLSKSILRDLILIKFQRCSLFHCLSSYNSIKEISEREPFRIESIKYKINLETMDWQNDWFLVFIEERRKYTFPSSFLWTRLLLKGSIRLTFRVIVDGVLFTFKIFLDLN